MQRALPSVYLMKEWKVIIAFLHRYLCDTPFPFSWAQLLIVMLLCFQFTLPFAMVSASE